MNFQVCVIEFLQTVTPGPVRQHGRWRAAMPNGPSSIPRASMREGENWFPQGLWPPHLCCGRCALTHTHHKPINVILKAWTMWLSHNRPTVKGKLSGRNASLLSKIYPPPTLREYTRLLGTVILLVTAPSCNQQRLHGANVTASLSIS